MASSYKSKTFFTYEQDFPNALAPGDSAVATFNTNGDSDFFWQKFAAFALQDGEATTRGNNLIPSVNISILNLTTGRPYMNAPVPIADLMGYQQFLPRLTMWPRKSSIQVTIQNVGVADVLIPSEITSGVNSDAFGIGDIGEDAEFIGYVSSTVSGGPFGSVTPSPLTVADTGYPIVIMGIVQEEGAFYFYMVAHGSGQQFIFGEFTTQLLPGGPVNTYTAGGAGLFLAEGDSGDIDGIPMTADVGDLWVWPDVIPADFVDLHKTAIIFPESGTTYSNLQLSFLGTKAFPG